MEKDEESSCCRFDAGEHETRHEKFVLRERDFFNDEWVESKTHCQQDQDGKQSLKFIRFPEKKNLRRRNTEPATTSL